MFPVKEGEDLLVEIVATQIKLSGKTANAGFIGMISEIVNDQRKDLVAILQRLSSDVVAMEAHTVKLGTPILSVYENLRPTYGNTERLMNLLPRISEKRWCENEKRVYSQANTSTHQSIVDDEFRGDLLSIQKSAILVSQWSMLLTSRQRRGSTMKTINLPRRLEVWSDEASSTSAPIVLPSHDKFKQSCDGAGADRRVSSIMAGLLYRWLEARCSEWHAELTRDKLLQSIDKDADAEFTLDEKGDINNRKKKKASESVMASTVDENMAHAVKKTPVPGNNEKNLLKHDKAGDPRVMGTSNAAHMEFREEHATKHEDTRTNSKDTIRSFQLNSPPHSPSRPPPDSPPYNYAPSSPHTLLRILHNIITHQVLRQILLRILHDTITQRTLQQIFLKVAKMISVITFQV